MNREINPMQINVEKLIKEDPRFGMYINAFMQAYVKSDMNEFIYAIYRHYHAQVPPDEAAAIMKEDEEADFTR